MSSTGWARGLVATKKGWGTKAKDRAPLSDMFNRFILHCERKGLTKRSQGAYAEKIPKHIAFLLNRKREFWQDVTQKDAEEWVSNIQRRDHLSDATKQGWLRTTKAFWRWAASEGLTDFSPIIPKLKKLPGKQYIPSPQVLNSFLNRFDQSTIWGFRDYVVAVTILTCGARIGEICNMAPEDILWDQNTIRLYGKGRKERFVPVEPDELFPLLQKWMQVRKEYAKGNGLDRLFVGRNGGKCCPNMFGHSFMKHRVRTGLGNEAQGTLSPHTLRHYFCSRFIEGGGSVFALQNIAGHRDLGTTLGYVSHASLSETAKREHAKVSPLKTLFAAGESSTPKKKRRMN
jgi:site-specific recombinase XerD